MDELLSLQTQLEEARDEAELNLLQLQQVQEELEFYFLRCQKLEQSRQASEAEATGQQQLQAARDQAERDQATAELETLRVEREQWKGTVAKALADAQQTADERDALSRERDALTQQLDALTQQRDAMVRERDAAVQRIEQVVAERDEVINRAEQHTTLLSTAQRMLEGQARYLDDVSSREEQAAQALDRIRLLEAEILYYIQHSKPLSSLDPQRINRLIQLAKQAEPPQPTASRR